MTLRIHMAKRRSGTIRTSQLRGKLSAVLLNAQKDALKKLETYVSTWDHDVFFETKGGTHYKGGNLEVSLSTDDMIFWYLERGTEVRYAVMTPDFQPKTATGQINSQVGQGGFSYLDKMPHDGIEPRRIGETIAMEEAEKFRENVRSVVVDVDFLGESLIG